MLAAGQVQAGRQLSLSRGGRTRTQLQPAKAFIQSKESVYHSSSRGSYQEEHHWYDLGDASRRFLLKLAGAAAAATLLTCAPSASPAHAEVQTVAPSQLTQLAKPLPQQEVNKGRIWTVFVGGAVVLFVTTVVAENNEAWFPAISRANKAMAQSRKASQKEEERAKIQEREASEVARQTKLVEAGLREVSRQQQVAPQQPRQQQQPVAPQPSQQEPRPASTPAAPVSPEARSQPQQEPVQHNVPPVLSSQDSNGVGSTSSSAKTPAPQQQQEGGYTGPSAATGSQQSVSAAEGLEPSALKSAAAVVGAAAAVANASKAARLEGFVTTMTGGAQQALRSVKSSVPPRL